MAKGTHMKNSAAELKAVAKAIGASLGRSGHPVPHTAVLNAVASALNKRNWNTLAGTAPVESAPRGQPPLATFTPEPEYTRGTWFLLQLAYFLGFGTPPHGVFREPDVRAWALQKTGGLTAGILKWGGWSLPADLDLKTCTLDANDFTPESNGVEQGVFLVQPSGEVPFSMPVSYSSATGWILSSRDTDQVMTAMAERIPRKLLWDLGVGKPARAIAAHVETDDRVLRVDFDAAGFFSKATSAQICAVLDAAGEDSEATDAVAQWEQSHGAAAPELGRIQAYLEELQQNPQCEVGFHCVIDVDAMLTWLETFRPVVLAHALCEHQTIELVACQEPELAGRWDWLSPFEGCPMSLDSEDDAAMHAMQHLGLLAAVRSQLG